MSWQLSQWKEGTSLLFTFRKKSHQPEDRKQGTQLKFKSLILASVLQIPPLVAIILDLDVFWSSILAAE